MNIRPFQPDDLSKLKQITTDVFGGVSIDQSIEDHVGLINDHSWQWRKSRHIDQDAARDSNGIFVATINDRTVGFITTWIDVDGGIGHIPNLAIDANHQGQGIGRRLIEFAMEHFRSKRIRCVRIETLVQNVVGKHLYESLGFKEVARQVHFVADIR
jgi:ribosomal protein S18 acetylase RimI-like enzyme